MPEHSTIEKNGRLKTRIILKQGEAVELCRCMQTKDFPFCDGTHKHIDTTAGPIVVEVLSSEEKTPPNQE